MALPLPAQDADLVVLARRGRDDAFGALYERYFPGVYDFLTRLLRDRQEAADVAQDTFIKAFERLGHLQKPESFKSWLFTIAHRNGLNRIERSKRAVAVGDFYVSEREAGELGVIDPDRAGDPERSAEARAAAHIIWEAAAGLDPRTYSVMDLHVRQGLDSAEIAEVLGVSKSNAYTMVSRMKKSFSEALSTYLLVRKGSADCPELAAIIAADSATGLTPDLRRSAERHAKTCEVCAENRKVLFMPIKMFAALAAAPIPAGLKATIWGSIQATGIGAGATLVGDAATPGPAASPEPPSGGVVAAAGRWVRSNIAGLAAAAVLIAVLFAGGSYLLGGDGSDPEAEVLSGGVTSTTTAPTNVATTAPPEESTPPASSSTTTSAPPRSTTSLVPVSTTVAPAPTTTTTSPPEPPPTTVAPPTLVVRADSATLDEDTTILIDVLANDTGYAPGAVPAVATPPAHGDALISGSSIAYTPEADYAGADQLAYSVKGRDGTTRTAQVSLTVVGINDAPVVPGPGELTVNEDQTIGFDPLEGASDVDGDTLEMSEFDGLSENGGTVTEGSLVYTPAADWSGTDKFTYTVTDGTVETIVTVVVAVEPVNDVPTGPVPVIEAVENGTGSGNVLDGWSDVEGDRITVANPGTRQTAQGGTATVGALGQTSYTPPAGFVGRDGFAITVTDGTDSVEVAVRVEVVDDGNSPPTVSDQTFVAAEGTPVGATLGFATADDPDGHAVTFEQVSISVFEIRPDGKIVLTSALDFESSQQHEIAARAVDELGAAANFTITLEVTDVDEAPTVAPGSWSVSVGAPTGTVVGAVDASDPEGAPLTYRITNGAGVLAIDSATGVITLAKVADAADFPISGTAFAADPGGNEGGAAYNVVLDLDDLDGPGVANFAADVTEFYASPPDGGVCTFRPRFATYAADVTDRSGVALVALHWRIVVRELVFAGTANMGTFDGVRYEVDFTPPAGIVSFTSHLLSTKVVATDKAGNLTETGEIAVTVLPCLED